MGGIITVEAVEYLVVALLVVQFIRLLLADADLSLLWYEKIGKKPDVLREEVVWITGASSGIGEYLAYDLARAGCKLVLSARRQEELERVKSQCLTHGRITEDDIMILPLDLLAYDSHKEQTDKVLEKFKKIDILVNNGGRSQRAMISETELEVDQGLMNINYLGTVSLTKAVLPHMIDRKKGHIVVTSSVAGKLGAPFSGAYSGSKFAVQGWFDTLRLEETMRNIYVTLVCPGPVVSNITEHAFTGKQGEVWGKPEADKAAKKMSTERCTELMAVAIANKLDEVWIANHPVLAVTYLSQYMPTLAKLVGKRLGMKAIMKIRYSAGKN